MELAAIALAIFHARTRLQGTAVTIYTDNNAALAALINGDSSSAAASILIATLWFIAAAHDIALWFERVETSRNIADLPTRNKPLPFAIRETGSFPDLSEVVDLYHRKIADHAIMPSDIISDLDLDTPAIFVRNHWRQV